MLILPNQIVAHKTPKDAWEYSLRLIAAYGSKVITEDRKLTKEIQNLQLCVLDPSEGWPIPKSGWDINALDKYAEQLLSGENPTNFEYTYGQRLHNLEGFDQIERIIRYLKNEPTSRRGIATTWQAMDMFKEHVPCLIVVEFLIRDSKLNLTAFFRSHDLQRAWPANVYGLWKLQEYVGNAVGVPLGSITTISASAHIYED